MPQRQGAFFHLCIYSACILHIVTLDFFSGLNYSNFIWFNSTIATVGTGLLTCVQQITLIIYALVFTLCYTNLGNKKKNLREVFCLSLASYIAGYTICLCDRLETLLTLRSICYMLTMFTITINIGENARNVKSTSWMNHVTKPISDPLVYIRRTSVLMKPLLLSKISDLPGSTLVLLYAPRYYTQVT